MPTNTIDLSPPASRLGAVPRAVWVGGGLLSLVTAGMAGALIMRAASVEPEPPAAPVSTGAPATTAAAATTAATPGQPVPLVAQAPLTSAPNTAPAAPAAPVARAKPATRHTTTAAPAPPLKDTTRTALCATCGVVESVSAVQRKGQGTGLGAVAGGVLGGVVGHQMGGGNGKTALTVLGAVGGGLAGNEVEKRARAETSYNVRVRMEDGSLRTIERAQSMAVGTQVIVEGTTLRVARSAPKSDEPRTMRTSAPAGGGNT
jgi:outer membrane lipoprotein SlyB